VRGEVRQSLCQRLAQRMAPADAEQALGGEIEIGHTQRMIQGDHRGAQPVEDGGGLHAVQYGKFHSQQFARCAPFSCGATRATPCFNGARLAV
jgi:hypothetical protein